MDVRGAGTTNGTSGVVVSECRCVLPSRRHICRHDVRPLLSDGATAVGGTPLTVDGVWCGCVPAHSYKVGTAKMDVLPLQESHTGAVTCVSFGARSDVFCSGSADGSIRVWDLSDYRVLQDMDGQAGSACATCVLFDETQMVSGWDDGCMRCHSAADGVRCCSCCVVVMP